MKARFSILLLFFSFNLFSQLPDGSIAPNITFTDIDGNTHTLYDVLDEGKSVVFDVMATWCGPCWNYQNTGILESLYDEYGPSGTNEIEIFMVESSSSTNEACLYGTNGCSGGTYGNWTAGVEYPIIHITGGNGGNFNNLFNINYFPTLYKICPNRKIYEVGQPPLSGWENWVTSCNLDATEDINNVVCFGQGESLIDLTVEGGYGNITYSWSNGATSQDLINVPTGDYSCTITEGQGHAIEVGPFSIDGPSTPLIVDIVNQNNVSCAGYNNGYILTSSSGGGTNYNYQWNNGANTQNLNNIPGGLYTLSVTDSYGCTETVSTSISEPLQLTLGTQPLNENCDQEDGAILLFANGGQGTYLYDIGQGPTTENVISNLAAGTYSATVTDENGCSSFSIATVENDPGPTAEAGNAEFISCNEESITLNGSGSSTGNEIIYSWETQDGNIVSGANTLYPVVDQAGVYTLTVSNILTNCINIDEVLVQGDLNAPESEAGEEATLTCIVEMVSLDGSNSSQGNEFEYQWLNEDNEEISTEITVDTNLPGTYELIVTNTDNGCTANSFVTVQQNTEAPIAEVGEVNEITCTTTTVNLDGGNSSQGNEFEYQWLNEDNEEISIEINVAVDQAGTYELIVTNTDNGCTQSSSVEVSQNIEQPTANAGDEEILTCTTTSVNLDGGNSSQGNEFEYQWLNEDNEEIGVDLNVDVDQAGTYELIVTNTDNGCTQSSSVDVSQNVEEPTSNAGEGDLLTCTTTSVNLDGGSSSQGNEFEYQWLNEDNEEISIDINVDVDQAGTYELIVTNTDNGCTQASSVDVSQNIEQPTSNAGDGDMLTCTTTSVNLDGGSSSQGNEFEYQWLNEANEEIGVDLNVAVDQAGTYELIVTNTDNGCTQSSSVEVSQNIEEPTSNAGEGDVLTCETSSVNLDGDASSQGNEFEYQWLNEANEEISVDINVDVDQAGTYELIVTNTDNGCTQSSSVEVSQNIEEPTSNAGEGDVLTCTTTSVNLDGDASSQGNEFEYQWLNENNEEVGVGLYVDVDQPGNYELIVTNTENGCTQSSSVEVVQNIQPPTSNAGDSDELNCSTTSVNLDGSASSQGNLFEYQWLNEANEEIGVDLNVAVDQAGTYELIVTNTDNGCTQSSSVDVSQNVEIPVANAVANGQLDCQISSIELDASNSSTGSEFEYAWFNSNNTNVGNTISIEVSAAEIYTLVVSNTLNGCTATTETEVTASIDLPMIEIEAEGNITCIDNTVTIDATGSSEGDDFYYQWLDPTNNEIGTNLFVDVNTPGSYTFIISNPVNGCSASSTVFIEEDIVQPVINITDPDILSCINTSVNLNASNSSPNGSLTFEWTNSAGDNIGSGESVDVSNAGIYSLLVTNTNNGCSASTDVQAAQLSEPILSLNTLNDVACFNGSDGSASLNITDGTAPYTYNWSNGASELEINNLAAGTYTLIVTDAIGCEDQFEVTISQPEDLVIQIDETIDNNCINDSQGAIDISILGGTGGYTYLWSNGLTTANIDNLESGTYSVIVTDQAGCERTASIEIISADLIFPTVETQNIMVTLDQNGVATISTDMINNGSFDNCEIASLGLDIENFDCSNIGQNQVNLTVTDVAGNSTSEMATVTIIDDIAPTISCIENIVSNSCQEIEYALPTASDNCGAMNPVLIEGLPSGSVFPVGETMITYRVEDLAGNIATCSFSVTVENTLENTFEFDNVSCFEENDGSVTALPTGGTPGYSFLWNNGETTQMLSDLSAGEYSVIITDELGCQFEKSITIEEPTILEITVDNISNEFDNNSNGSIEVNISGGTAGYNYQWMDINGQVVSNEEDLLNVPAGEYTLTVSDINGCTLSSEVFVIDNIVATTNLDFEKYIQITPNPTSGEVFVSIELDKSMTVQLSILDVTGRVLLSWNPEDISTKTYQMNLADFSNGIYLTRVILDGKTYVQKLVLVKQ